MTFSSLNVIQQTTNSPGSFDIDKMRGLIAKQLNVDIKNVTDDAYFSDDLGANWLDRLELMILIEDQFAGVEIADDDTDQIEVVGDLIRYVHERRSRSKLAPTMRGRPRMTV